MPDINRQLINERKGRVYAAGERKNREGKGEKGENKNCSITNYLTNTFFLYFSLLPSLSFALSLFLEQVILQHKSMLAGQAASY